MNRSTHINFWYVVFAMFLVVFLQNWWAESRRVETMERHSRAATGVVVYEGPYDVRLYGWRELRALLLEAGFQAPSRSSFTPAVETLTGGLGETFGAMSRVLFVAARG